MTKQEMMSKIEVSVKNCTKCRLYKTALHAVPGEGNVESEIVFIGEAPGQTEDQTGRPFVGRAGQLLEKSLAEIGLKRSQVWIGNIIKHRPPDNRDPLPDEIHACEKFLSYQLKIMKPKLVVTLGRFAMNYFYPEGKITQDRGSLVRTSAYNVYPVYHPAAALRNPTMMRGFIEDFKRIPDILAEAEKPSNLVSQQEPEENTDGQLGLGL